MLRQLYFEDMHYTTQRNTNMTSIIIIVNIIISDIISLALT